MFTFLGIAIVSMLTATLTNVISYAEDDPTTDMSGKTVGTLMYRSYDAAIVAKHGGVIDPIDYNDVITGIDHLLQRLFEKNLPGYYFHLIYFSFFIDSLNALCSYSYLGGAQVHWTSSLIVDLARHAVQNDESC